MAIKERAFHSLTTFCLNLSPALSPHRPHIPMAGHTAWISLTLLMTAVHQPADIWAHPMETEPTDLFLEGDVANDFIGQSSEVSDLLESFTEQVEGAWERVKEIFEEITDVELME